MTTATITAEHRTRLAEIVSAGLTTGAGTGTPGSLCIESAICLALGEPHSDKPSCVAAEDRSWATRINDAAWSSPQARAEALLPIGLAQLGTAGTDRTVWVARVVEGTIRRVLPIVLRAAADRATAEHAEALRAAADRCEREGKHVAAYAVDAAYAYAAAYAAAVARAAAVALAAADARAASYAALAAARAAAANGDHVLRIACEVALDAYRQEGR